MACYNAGMDLLADVLHQAGLKRRILHQSLVGADAAIAFPCDKSFGFHVVTQGRAYLHSAALSGSTDGPLELNKGDVALMSRGCHHIVSTGVVLPAEVLPMQDDGVPSGTLPATGATPQLALVSGAYQVWNTPVHPFFDDLPAWYVLRAQEMERFDQVELAISLLAGEVARPEPGSETVTKALLDIIFTQLIRKIMARHQDLPSSWSHALQNVQVKAALELMHADCAHEWTVDDLARRVGLSRAGFAQKFKHALGSPPLQYLTTVRVQKAMDLLSNTDDKLETVSQLVGYRDAFSFSKAFKKLVGIPPKEFRARDRDEKQHVFRL